MPASDAGRSGPETEEHGMTLLAPYRVLDLTDERGQIAGMMLADLGADVLRVEPPGGSDARRSGPFLDSGPTLERSLSFAAYNRNKRSVEIDLAMDSGRETFLALVRDSDFVLDSGPPSILDQTGLDFERLLEANDQIVQVRTTPFGSDGPMADAPASDLTIAALGGPMSVQGDADRPPVRLSVPQAWRHAGAEAAVAAMIGHARMRTTGAGVFVDVSAQSALTWTMLNASLAGPIQGFDYQRQGSNLQIGPKGGLPMVHPCKDGYVVALGLGALLGKLRPWILESGVVEEAWLDREDWKTYDYRIFRGGEFVITLEELTEVFDRFFLTRTKKELFAPGLDLGVTIAPIQTLDDLLDFDQLIAREYFRETELVSGQTAKAPGAFAKLSRTPLERRMRAPRLGEHDQEILDELKKNPRRRIALHSEGKALPLEGLNVADFSWVGVGPISGKYLADHGANVIRIESATKADNLRTAGPYKDDESGWNRSHFYGEFNTSKRSLALDLKHAGSAEVKSRLLGWADVVLESFTPEAVDRLGIGYEDARKANPGVIMVSTCLMGQTGPVASMAGYGYHAAGVAGFYELTGWPDRAPVGPWNAYTDTIAPRFLTTTLLAALDHKRRTGEGQHIDLGQMEAALHFLAPEILSRQATGEVYDRCGNRDPRRAPQGVYPCAGLDEWVAVAIDDDVQWMALRKALGEPAWAGDQRFDSVAGRLAEHDAIDASISEWTRERKPREAMQLLLDAGVPAGHVQRSSDLPSDPQLVHRRFYRELEHAEMGRVPYSGHQFRVSGYDNGPRSPAPLLGGESFEILVDELGFEPETVADLMASGAIN
jgi:crotonobetainyl-CoA:carnitine CoA-transferase CaiB-like acyl-CoA transferase